ncbi:MAG: hypothetical protein ALECFALPRED_004320 [Alectoria fallacina]|uniref:NADP-dependent oxidoreductase domain-containing protein n=1 Tax=Alectoria fallacina TaxID=1903189 RepID=A0A8H3FUB2_9LECA|nr:MAG: hypothetical protein ALECFALPRED_004320 [Alectoria fallacina]
MIGRKVGGTGYGLTSRHAIPSEEQAFAALHIALASGCNLWDGGEIYGTPDYNSLTLLKKYYALYPEDADKVVLNIKGAMRPGWRPDGSPAFVRESVEKCLRMLGERGRIDMFECARRDPKVPLGETLGALAELVNEGKIGGVALSEVSAGTVRQAVKITKIVAVEVELSLWSTEPLTNGIADACAEFDILIIAYSPIGRGMLTGQIKSFEDIPHGDLRKILPRYQPENFENNIKLVKELEKMAQKKHCTTAQLALAWIRSLSNKKGMPQIIPIPGATTAERVKENAVEVELTEWEMKDIDTILARCEVIGDRYHPMGMTMING